jgi:hypothetical protein
MKTAAPCMLIGLAVVLLIVLSTPFATAQTSVIVSRSSSNAVAKEEVKEMFTGARLTWSSGTKVQIADQPDTDLGKKFYESFLGKTLIQVRGQWTKLVLSGQASAPIKCADDDAVKKAVAANANAVGIISSKSLDGTVKEILRIE